MSIHDGHRQRIRAEFMARPDVFPDYKMLELLLYYSNPRKDTNPLAHVLMEQFGSLSGVLDALPEELKKVEGVGEQTAVLLKITKEISSRYAAARVKPSKKPVTTSEDIYQLLHPYFFGATAEKIYVLCLDSRNRCLGVRLINEGTVNTSAIVVRKLIEAALSLNAVGVVLAHNHPNGWAKPSRADEVSTDEVEATLRAVNVRLLDHVVFDDESMYSMRHNGGKFQPL